MTAVQDSYLGMAEEVTYGTAVAPARFFEMADESIVGKYEDITSSSIRAGQRAVHKDRFQPNPKGAEGDVNLEVQDGSFGLPFKHALGTIASGAPAGGFTTHTATVADLKGRGMTWQVGRVDNTGTMNVFTYEAGKVKSWELSSKVDGILMLKLGLDFGKETIGAGAGAYAAATPTYNTTAQLFTFIGGTVSIGGTEFAVSDAMFAGDNNLNTSRYFLRSAGGGKKEQLEEGMRKFTFDLMGEFEGVTHINRVASATAAGSLATLSATWASPQGGQLVVTVPVARFDEGPVNFSGAKIITQPLKGEIVWDGSSSPVTIAYKSKDATP